MTVIARLPAPGAPGGDRIDLLCPNGHRTTHSLARLMRLNDGWCGRCGADIAYPISTDAAAALGGHQSDGLGTAKE